MITIYQNFKANKFVAINDYTIIQAPCRKIERGRERKCSAKEGGRSQPDKQWQQWLANPTKQQNNFFSSFFTPLSFCTYIFALCACAYAHRHMHTLHRTANCRNGKYCHRKSQHSMADCLRFRRFVRA